MPAGVDKEEVALHPRKRVFSQPAGLYPPSDCLWYKANTVASSELIRPLTERSFLAMSAPARRVFAVGLAVITALAVVIGLWWCLELSKRAAERFRQDRTTFLQYVHDQGGGYDLREDNQVSSMILPESAGEAEIEEAKRLFPEAEIGHPKYRRVQ